jgi:hypothetical protein
MFDSSALNPRRVFEREFGSLPRVDRKGWTTVCCCFHNDHRPSLRLNVLGTGRFFCFACSETGDTLEFLRKKHGVSFQEACRLADCWTGHVSLHAQKELDRNRREREHIQRSAQILSANQQRLRMEVRNELHVAERLKRQISDRLRILPLDCSEAESCWDLLEMLEREIGENDAAYRLLSFGSAKDRARFVLNEAAREEMISAVLFSGGISDDEGRFMEVRL